MSLFLLPRMIARFHPILFAAAILPALWLLVKVYRTDRLEPEPPALILSLVALGILSTSLAAFTERVGAILLGSLFSTRSVTYSALFFFLVVGLSEEGFKYLLLRSRTWSSPHFNCQFDGVVYAVSVSLGFALWENISYVMRYGFTAAAIRAVTAVPGHACFGVFMGIWYGAAKRMELAGQYQRSKTSRAMAVAIPILLHGAYDLIASQVQSAFSLIFLAFIAVLFWGANSLVRHVSDHDIYLQ